MAWKCLRVSASAAAQSIGRGAWADPVATAMTSSASSDSLRMRGMVTRTFAAAGRAAGRDFRRSDGKSVGQSAAERRRPGHSARIGSAGLGSPLARGGPRHVLIPQDWRRLPGRGRTVRLRDWLRTAAIEPVLLVDACMVSSDAAGLRLSAVVADAALLSREFIAALRHGDARLPILAVGDEGDPAEPLLHKRGVSFIPDPSTGTLSCWRWRWP